MSNITTKDKKGRILVDGEFKVCNVIDRCSGSSCQANCLINMMIERLYYLEHKENNQYEE